MQAGGQEFDPPHLHQTGRIAQVWLERTPDKREVDGSSPFVPTISFSFAEKEKETKEKEIA